MGRRVVDSSDVEQALQDVARLQPFVNELRLSGLLPRGVFRFASCEEADDWILSPLACPAARRRRAAVS